MEVFKVCRVCLATNVTLYNFHSNSLELYDELLTGINPLLELNLPMIACVECTALLTKFFLFKEKCLRGQGILQGLFQKYGKITEGYVKEIDRERFLLTSSLSICDTSFVIDINSDHDNDNTYKEDTIMKDEDEPTISKIEIEYEHKYDILEEWSSDEELTSDKKDTVQQEIPTNFDEPGDEKLQEYKEEKKVNTRMKTKRAQLTSRYSNIRMNVPNEMAEKVNIDSHVKKVILTKEEQRAEFEKRRESDNYQTAPFKCELCFKPFWSEKTLQNHAIRHDKASGRHECDICKLHFKLISRYKLHMTGHSMKFLCNTCPYVSRRLNQAKQHVLWHKGVVYKCPYCDAVRSKWTSYLGHVRKKHPSDHICTLCGFSFVSEKGLVLHKTKMHRELTEKEIEANSEAPYCEDCDVRFASEEAHRRHLLTAKRHAQENPKSGCRECGVTFTSDTERRDHRHAIERCYRPRDRDKKTITSKQAWPINCPHCSEEIISAQRCFWHFRRNHPDKKYPLSKDFICEVCGKAFASQGLLNYHTRCDHEQSRACTCPTCGKTFATRHRLNNHARAHSAARPHECELCGRVYKSKSALGKHIRVHTGEKRFKCKVCGKAFAQSDSCDIHLRTVHLGLRRVRKRTKDSVKASTSYTKDSVKARTSRTKDSVKAHTSRIKAVTGPSPDSSPGGSSSDASTRTSS